MPASGNEYYAGVPMPAGSSRRLTGGRMAGFLRTSAEGAITVTSPNGTVILNAMPLAPGFNRIPLAFNHGEGVIVSLDMLGAGTLLI